MVRFVSPELVFDAISRFQPDIILLLGEAGGRFAIAPERIAINLDDFPIPDNAGNQPREERVVESGPAAYFSTLPLVEIQAALREKGISVALSNTAGTYVCNHLFYRVMHHLVQTKNPAQAGFIHIPVCSPANLDSAENGPALALETLIEGVQIAVETCLCSRSAG